MKTTQRGITLIEILFSVAIGSVLLALSLPSFAALSERNALAASHNLLMSSFATARETAIVQRSTTVLCPGDTQTGCRKDGIWDGGWMVFVDRDNDGAFDADDTLVRAESALPAELAARSSKHRPRVTFKPSGMTEGSNLTVKLCDAQGKALDGVVTSNTGRTRASTDGEIAAMSACF